MNWEKKQNLKVKDFIQDRLALQKARAKEVMAMFFGNKNKIHFLPSQCDEEPYTYDDYGNWFRRDKKVEKPKKPWEGAYAYSEWLQKKGFKRLGSGAFSTVYGKESSDKVIKVTRCIDNFVDYALWAAKEGYAGNYAPKVYSFKKYSNDFCVTVVERMKGTINGAKNSDPQALVCGLLKYSANHDNVYAGVLLDQLYPGFADFGIRLEKKFGRLDIHEGNIMVRQDGSICFTDPVCDSDEEPSYNRLKAKDFTSLAKAIRRLYESKSIRNN